MLLLLVEAMLLFSGSIVAVYVRLGVADAEDALINRNGFYKAALATVFCLTSFYLFDLYDFVVMHDRRELVLRMLQALGLAWIALALLFYVVPQVMIGRGVSLISLPAALLLMVWCGNRILGSETGYYAAWLTVFHPVFWHAGVTSALRVQLAAAARR